MPEVVAAISGSAVLDLSKHDGTRPLARVFEIVQLLVSSAGFEIANPKFAIEMTIAPRWQARLLKAEITNGSDAMEAQLKADLACHKNTRTQVDATLKRMARFCRPKDEQQNVDVDRSMSTISGMRLGECRVSATAAGAEGCGQPKLVPATASRQLPSQQWIRMPTPPVFWGYPPFFGATPRFCQATPVF